MERLRKSIHIGCLGLALLFRYPWFESYMALAIAGSGVLFNLLLFPRIGLIYRDGERRLRSGVVYFPLSLFFVVLLFWTIGGSPQAAAAGWALMSLGDGFAGLAGRRFGGLRLPWNQRKTCIGLAAFFAAGGIGTALMLQWVGLRSSLDLPWPMMLATAGAAALLCGILESLPWKLDDNLTVPFAGGTFVFLAWGVPVF